MPVEWSPDPKSAKTCASSVFPKLPCSEKKPHKPTLKKPNNKKTTADLAGSKVPFQFISLQCSLRIPMTCGEWVHQNSMEKRNGWDRLGNILWDLFKVQRFLTCRGPECKRIASDLLRSSSFRVIWRQCSLGACWNWWKATVLPARKAGNLELDLGKSSPASQAAAFSDSLPQQRQMQEQDSDFVYIHLTPCKAVASGHLLTLVLPRRN